MIQFLFKNFTFLVILSLLLKLVFLFIYRGIIPHNFSNVTDTLLHGLPLDLATAAYITILPDLCHIIQLWIESRFFYFFYRFYLFLISLSLVLIFSADLTLYKYWGFRLDSTPIFYLLSSPKEAFASLEWEQILALIIGAGLITYLLYKTSKRLLVTSIQSSNYYYPTYITNVARIHPSFNKKKTSKIFHTRWSQTLIGFFGLGLLFLAIRGGIKVSTLNTGRVYYSSNMVLNHAAINPCFSLLESVLKSKDFSKQYQYLKPEKAKTLFETMRDTTSHATTPKILRTKRPNICIFLLESFMARAMTSIGEWPNIQTHMDSLGQEGILFTHHYANSFRTDRGMVAVFSGFPAQPTMSVIKYPRKTQQLPSLPKKLHEAGYAMQYCYGGDADFTNMRSYLTSMGFEDIIEDIDFPLSSRLSKWGVHDDILLDSVARQITKGEEKEPFFKIIHTSSSHEPFDVPFHRAGLSKEMNALAYADSCVGDFIHKIRQTKYWDNTLFVLVADHTLHYPIDIDNLSDLRYHIPLIFCGGAVKKHQVIDTYGSQNDIAATILSQLEMDHSEFTFSHDMINPNAPHFGYFAFPNAFGMITENGSFVWDATSESQVRDSTPKESQWGSRCKSFIQTIYQKIASL